MKWETQKKINKKNFKHIHVWGLLLNRGIYNSLARPGRKQVNVSVRMVWISFGTLLCRKKKTWWQLAFQCCWNRARPWHASELVSFLVGLRNYQHPGTQRIRLRSACKVIFQVDDTTLHYSVDTPSYMCELWDSEICIWPMESPWAKFPGLS